tara:strand:- start:86 stop:523 length:438 start_codon:yes stop_codon:yes gene_type:complete
MEEESPEMQAMMADEEQPLMEEEKAEEDSSKPGPNDYVETDKFCFCCSLKCGIITIGLLFIIDFILEALDLNEVAQNEYFDPIYWQVYLVLLVIYAIGAIMFLVYIIWKDGPKTRALVPWALMIGAIVNLLLIVWICVYIFCIYK